MSIKEEYIVEKESYDRDAEIKLSSKEVGEDRGGKIVGENIELPVCSPDVLGLKVFKISRRKEGGVDKLLIEGMLEYLVS